MNLLEIRNEVKVIIQDTGFTDAQIDKAINDAYLYCATICQIPTLKTLGYVTVTANTNFTSLLLTEDGKFDGMVSDVRVIPSESLSRFDSMEELYAEYESDETGEIEAYAVEGNNLWIAPTPTVDTQLLIIYYRFPEYINDPMEIPDLIPDGLHRQLLVNGASYFIFNTIEDGSEAEKINTSVHFSASFDTGNKNSGISKFKEWLSRSRRGRITKSWMY